jgi:hypothetical protein
MMIDCKLDTAELMTLVRLLNEPIERFENHIKVTNDEDLLNDLNSTLKYYQDLQAYLLIAAQSQNKIIKT